MATAITGSSFGETNALSSIVLVLVGTAALALVPVLGRWVMTRSDA